MSRAKWEIVILLIYEALIECDNGEGPLPATFQKLQINHNSPMMRIEMWWRMILIIIMIMIMIIVIYCCKNSYKLADHYNLIVFDLSKKIGG